MRLLEVEFRLLSPLQYFSTQAAGGMRTAPFIGDLALTYSMAHSFGLIDYPPINRSKPHYDEITDFPFLFTVAVPTSVLKYGEWTSSYIKQMTRNTMHGIDFNGTNVYSGYRVGSAMYKNFYFVQLLKPSQSDSFHGGLILLDEKLKDLPSALRVGNGKTGILSLQYREPGPASRFYINRYTIETVLNKEIPTKDFETVYHPVHQYHIMGPVSESDIFSMMAGQ